MSATATPAAAKTPERIEHKGILEVRDLCTYFKLSQGWVHAVEDVSFSVAKGESLGLAGESGCGKTTAALSILKLLPENGRIVSGDILFDGRNLAKRTEYGMSKIRWKEISMIFQGAMNALNPVQETGKQIAEPIMLHEGLSESKALDRARELFELVGINPKRVMDFPAPALGRHAPAGDDRHGAGLQPEARHRRRADHRSRRHGAGADPRAHRAPAQGARSVVHPHQPRPLGHGRDLRQGRDHVRRQAGRVRDDDSISSATRCTPTRSGSSRPSPTSTRSARWCPRSTATRPTCSSRRRGAASRRAATRG